MEPNRFLFKLTAIFLQYIFTIVVFLPIVYLVHLVKYNFNTEQIVFLRVLFFAIAFAMPFVVANAFAFAKYEHYELNYYLKPKQKHTVGIDQNSSLVLTNIKANLALKPFWKLTNQSEDSAEYLVKNILVTDRVTIEATPFSDSKTKLTIQSKPTMPLLFLDFGRNYQNIINVLLATNTTPATE